MLTPERFYFQHFKTHESRALHKEDVLHLLQAYGEHLRREAESDHRELMQLLEYCRSVVADGVTKIKKAVQGRQWLMEGRGPYEWGDDNWHQEFALAAAEILVAVEPLAREAADWDNCPRTAAEVAESRRNLKAEILYAKGAQAK